MPIERRGNNKIAMVTGGVLYGAWVPPPRQDMESIMLENSPSRVLAQYIWDTVQLLTNPNANDDWPLYIASLPDDPSNASAVYDTSGTLDGRHMTSGQVIQHFGIQLRLRSLDYEDGWKKLEAVCLQLDAVDSAELTVNDTDYIIDNVSRRTPIVPLGPEEGVRRREIFTVNYIMTIQELD